MALPLSYSVRSLFARRLRTGLTVGVMGVVVVATTFFLGFISSLQRTLRTTGSERNLIVMRKGSSNDGSSQLQLVAFQDIRFFEGVARDAAGNPMVSPELVVQPFFRRKDGGRENVLVRGVEPAPALAVHDEVRIVEGRMFEPSSGEVVVGRYEGAQLGQTLEFGRGSWQVVGVFESRGDSFESEVWADVRELANDAKRPFPSSSLRLPGPPAADRDGLG